MAKYGLIGRDLSYSFSKSFFTHKFEQEKRKDSYHNFEIENIEQFLEIIKQNRDLKGLNVTTPYKEKIIPYLDKLDADAEKIGAVNTIKFRKDGKLIGYNTDHYAFAKALPDCCPTKDKSALILGSGGVSKAIQFVLEMTGFNFQIVSRKKSETTITYESLTQDIIDEYFLIVNCTPSGTFPKINECPKIPYQFIGKHHVLFDLVYNPKETEFMKRGFVKGARVSNGLKMLEYQAKKSWEIWKS